MEAKARSDYVILKLAINRNFTVEDTGHTFFLAPLAMGMSMVGKALVYQKLSVRTPSRELVLQWKKWAKSEQWDIPIFVSRRVWKDHVSRRATNFMLKFKGRWQLRPYHDVTLQFGPMRHKTIFVLTEFILIQSLCPLWCLNLLYFICITLSINCTFN